MHQEKRTPAAGSGAAEAGFVQVGVVSDYLKRDVTARRHDHAAVMLRIALTLAKHRFTAEGRMEVWRDFATVTCRALTEEERALLAYWTGRTLTPETRAAIFDGAHWGASHG